MALVEIGSLIERQPGIRGGRPKIAGTGITVRRIAGCYKAGMSPADIADEYSHLNLAQVHAALAYYHANREEIEADIAEENNAVAYWEHRLGPRTEVTMSKLLQSPGLGCEEPGIELERVWLVPNKL